MPGLLPGRYIGLSPTDFDEPLASSWNYWVLRHASPVAESNPRSLSLGSDLPQPARLRGGTIAKVLKR
jgi:hypothetical protein